MTVKTAPSILDPTIICTRDRAYFSTIYGGMVSNAITNGELIEILPKWQVEPIPIHAVWHGNATHNSNIRRLLEFLFAD